MVEWLLFEVHAERSARSEGGTPAEVAVEAAFDGAVALLIRAGATQGLPRGELR